MGRHLVAGAVVLAEAGLFAAVHPGLPWPAALAYAVVVVLVVLLRSRAPVAAFGVALVLAAFTGAGFVLLVWSSLQAGYGVRARAGVARLIGAGVGGVGLLLVPAILAPARISTAVSICVVFVLLPVLAGRYLGQHRRLVAALDRQNRQLREQRPLLAERERLRERLRIARDMHDSLGQQLSLVSLQAGALECAALPAAHHAAVGQLAEAAREATRHLYELVGSLREPDDAVAAAPGLSGIDELVAAFRAAGVAVTVHRHGPDTAVPAAVGAAAYRVVQEGLTNAARHAPGQPVALALVRESDTLLLTLTNPAPPATGSVPPGRRGHGLSGLDERVRLVGGLFDVVRSGGTFRVGAMLPTTDTELSPVDAAEEPPPAGRVRTVVLGAAVAVLMFAVLPASILLGVR